MFERDHTLTINTSQPTQTIAHMFLLTVAESFLGECRAYVWKRVWLAVCVRRRWSRGGRQGGWAGPAGVDATADRREKKKKSGLFRVASVLVAYIRHALANQILWNQLRDGTPPPLPAATPQVHTGQGLGSSRVVVCPSVWLSAAPVCPACLPCTSRTRLRCSTHGCVFIRSITERVRDGQEEKT